MRAEFHSYILLKKMNIIFDKTTLEYRHFHSSLTPPRKRVLQHWSFLKV